MSSSRPCCNPLHHATYYMLVHPL